MKVYRVKRRPTAFVPASLSVVARLRSRNRPQPYAAARSELFFTHLNLVCRVVQETLSSRYIIKTKQRSVATEALPQQRPLTAAAAAILRLFRTFARYRAKDHLSERFTKLCLLYVYLLKRPGPEVYTRGKKQETCTRLLLPVSRQCNLSLRLALCGVF